jgi:hypothetical protein
MHTSFKYQGKRISPRGPNLKAQQNVVKNHIGIHNRPNASGPITPKTYITDPTNGSSPNSETDQ